MRPSIFLKKTYCWLVNNLYVKPLTIFSLRKNKELWNASSYYPEEMQKATLRNYLFQVGQVLKYGRPQDYFFMYGLDVKSKDECETYLNYKPFMDRRNFLNRDNNPHNSTCILRNKLYFDIFARAIGVTTPKIVAYFSGNKLHAVGDGFRMISFEELAGMEYQRLFCKEMSGECGAGIFVLEIKDREFFIESQKITSSEIAAKIKNAEYIFQEIVIQHQEMSRLYPNSINTMHMVTVRSLKDGELHLMPSILRIGARGSFVDNTSQGGLACGFDLETGRLHQYGFHKPKFGLRVEVHPDTGVRLSEFFIPFVKEAEKKALYFHSMLPDIHSIGWDIAIGPNGPIFIEGNDNWEINGPQVGNHGLKKEFEEYFYK